MGIKIYPNTKIYIVAPAATATGGPELLHQLCFHLRNDLELKAYMFYIPSNHPSPIHPAYTQYNNPFFREIEDKEKNLLIVPEVIQSIKILGDYKRIRKIIWWLSVDNLYISYILSSRRNFFLKKLINKITQSLFKTEAFNIQKLAVEKISKGNLRLQNFKEIKQIKYHLVQSYYAMHHLIKNGISQNKILYLSDYLNMDFLRTETNLSHKENIVVYNPKKSFPFIKELMKCAPEIKFIPLINMTRKEIIQTLQKAKVYIDFGNHPGKDRLPREAAILYCCVITGKRGSAAFYEDVPIPSEYKFEDKKENIPQIILKIKECFEQFETKCKDFESYRKFIREEPKRFLKDLRKIFIKVL